MAEYYFNLPQITDLTIPQQSALYETAQIALSGGPGTGKSVVSLWRHISNHKNNKTSLLLTYTTTLAKYLSVCCRPQSKNAANNVSTSLRGKPRRGSNSWSEIIVDEAQDLPINYYKDIEDIAKVSYGADDSQILYPDSCSTNDELKQLFCTNIDYDLNRNFRSTQSIMQFAKTTFSDAYIPNSIIRGLSNNIGVKPRLLISERNSWNGRTYDISNKKQDNAIITLVDELRTDDTNIAILVPFKKDVIYFDELLQTQVTDYSIYYEDEKVFPNGCKMLKNVHITTFKSAKGLEFDTVIIPNFYNLLVNSPIKIKTEETMDERRLSRLEYAIQKLKEKGFEHSDILAKDREENDRYKVEYKKLMFSWNDLYVAVTRARSNLFLISSNNISNLQSVTEIERL